MTTLQRISSKTPEWYTPQPILEKVRIVFDGNIELDPASCDVANLGVKADRYYTKDEDGLNQDWFAKTVLLNPPGGKTGNKSNSQIWWNKFLSEFLKGNFQHGIYIGFSVEMLCINPTMLNWFICFCRQRIKFIPASLQKDNPTHSNFILLVSDDTNVIKSFSREFFTLGKVVNCIDV